jgi:translation initiation factor IF-2
MGLAPRRGRPSFTRPRVRHRVPPSPRPGSGRPSPSRPSGRPSITTGRGPGSPGTLRGGRGSPARVHAAEPPGARGPGSPGHALRGPGALWGSDPPPPPGAPDGAALRAGAFRSGAGPSSRRPRRSGGGERGPRRDPGGRGRHCPGLGAGRLWIYPGSLTAGAPAEPVGRSPAASFALLYWPRFPDTPLAIFQDPSHATQA